MLMSGDSDIILPAFTGTLGRIYIRAGSPLK
jgi:hypothetical protein